MISFSYSSRRAHVHVLPLQLVFGLGVGGEYPVASSSAAERAEADKSLQDRRGETVVLTFSMQGVGNVANVIVLMILLAAFNQNGPKYDPTVRTVR